MTNATVRTIIIHYKYLTLINILNIFPEPPGTRICVRLAEKQPQRRVPERLREYTPIKRRKVMLNEQDEHLLHTELVKVVRRMRKIKLSVLSEQVIYSEYVALSHISRYVKENPDSMGIYVSELADRMDTKISAVSRMLNSIEGKGLITRTVNVKDRRNTYVCLTPAGEQVLADSTQNMEQLRKQMIQRMGHDDVCRLIELWNKLAGIMEDEVDHVLRQQKERETPASREGGPAETEDRP